MNEKAIYTQQAPEKGNVKSRTFAFVGMMVILIALLVVVNMLPYSGILSIALFAAGAYFIHKLLSTAVFDITYALCSDKLVFLRKYGKLTWECEVFPFDEAKFYPDRIEHRGKTYNFSPDEKLRELLGI